MLQFILSFCLIAITLTSFTINSVTVELTGHLKNRSGSGRNKIDHISVFVKGKNLVLGKAVSNSKGVFHLSWNDNKAKAFYFYCVLGRDTLLLAKISKFESDAPDYTFILPDHIPKEK